MATLVVTDGPANGRQFALEAHRLVMVGRDDACTFQLIDAQMSRQHFQVKRLDDGGHSAIDFGSANGVFVNGRRLEAELPLLDGDEIKVGDSVIVYMAADSPDAETVTTVVRRRREHMKSTMVRDGG